MKNSAKALLVIVFFWVLVFANTNPVLWTEKTATESNETEIFPDSDGDGMNDYFENLSGFDPLVPNERYMIRVASTLAPPGSFYDHPEQRIIPFEPINYTGYGGNEARYILLKNNWKEENIIYLLGENATDLNFEKAVSEISKKVTENDLVYIDLGGHGTTGRFCFNNTYRSYEWIDEVLDNIMANRVILIIAACYAGDPEAIKVLAEGPCPRLVIGPYNALQYSNVVYGLWKKVLNETIKDMDYNEDGYVSFKESWLFYVKSQYALSQEYSPEKGWNCTVEKGEGGSLFYRISNQEIEGYWYDSLIDLDNIGGDTYWGDATVEDLKEG